MTKEELEKEAGEYAREWLYHVKDLELYHKEDDKPKYIRIKEGYLAGAEPREKQIAELTEQNTSLLTSVENLNKSVQELEKENAELKSRDCWKSCEYANPKSELIVQHIKDVQQLTNAKEIIKKLVLEVKSYEEINGNDTCEPVKEAEQFLSEVEK